MIESKKLNLFEEPQEDLDIRTHEELEEAKKLAGVVTPEEHKERIMKSGDEKLKQAATKEGMGIGKNKIEERGGVLINVSDDGEDLLDQKTGEPISDNWEKIEVRDGIVVGYRGAGFQLINPETGDHSDGYDAIVVRNGLILGKRDDLEFILDKKTCDMASRGYERIEKRGNNIIGIDDGREELVKLWG